MMFTLDTRQGRLAQAKVLVQAARAKAREPDASYDDILALLLQEVLDNPWVDEELESNLRQTWVDTLGNVEIVNNAGNVPETADTDEHEIADTEVRRRWVLYDFDADCLLTTRTYATYEEAVEDASRARDVLVLPLDW